MMRPRAGTWLLRLWLAAALLVLLGAGRLPEFLALAAPASCLALVGLVEVRRQLAPPWQRHAPPAGLSGPACTNPACGIGYPHTHHAQVYRLADDPAVPLCEVVGAAERAVLADAGWPEPTVPVTTTRGGPRG
jgi:hypothetical protein